MSPVWDIFCKVVDNYGDAGVCWRLARQLAAEHGLAPRLWIDDLRTLGRLAPRLNAALESQTLNGVTVRRWAEPFAAVEPGEVVVETFGCDLPAAFAARVAQAETRPVWINLEHLSAEPWVEDCHLLPSPHPRLGVTRWFFYPGFNTRTGGLLREQDLFARRDAFQSDQAAERALWEELGLPAREDEAELRVLLFCYDTAAPASLINALACAPSPTRLLVPHTVARTAVESVFGQSAAPEGQLIKQNVIVHTVPFLPQETWDRVLWACDLSIVRGEDSFVRAQWAGRPFLWDIYPQTDGAHQIKLAAFLDAFLQGLDPTASGALSDFYRAWGSGMNLGTAWTGLAAQLPVIRAHSRAWSDRLAARPDLARNIIDFASQV